MNPLCSANLLLQTELSWIYALSSSTTCTACLNQCFIHDALSLAKKMCQHHSFFRGSISIWFRFNGKWVAWLLSCYLTSSFTRVCLGIPRQWCCALLIFVFLITLAVFLNSSPKITPTRQTNSKLQAIRHKCAWTIQIPKRMSRRTPDMTQMAKAWALAHVVCILVVNRGSGELNRTGNRKINCQK